MIKYVDFGEPIILIKNSKTSCRQIPPKDTCCYTNK